jgi:hypothetical protein
MPPEIASVWVPFDWDNARLWSLDLPVEVLSVRELTWLLDLPCWRRGEVWFVVRPRDVLGDPDAHPEHRDRIARADLRWPIDVMHHQGRWVMLDGLHRLAKAVQAGEQIVPVRKLPAHWVDRISR